MGVVLLQTFFAWVAQHRAVVELASIFTFTILPCLSRCTEKSSPSKPSRKTEPACTPTATSQAVRVHLPGEQVCVRLILGLSFSPVLPAGAACR